MNPLRLRLRRRLRIRFELWRAHRRLGRMIDRLQLEAALEKELEEYWRRWRGGIW